MARLALVVMLAACSDPPAMPDASGPIDAAVADELVVSPVGVDFGSYDVRSGDPPKRFTFDIGNTGAITASLTTIAIGGPHASDFTIVANDCGATLAPREVCNVSVAFIASAADERNAVLQITGSTSATTRLYGKGIAPPSRIRFTPGARNFGDVDTGGTGAPFTFAVTNDAEPTTLTASLGGAGATGFRIASTDCTGAVLPLGGTCSVTVELVPPFGGDYIADVALMATNGSVAKAGLTGASTTPLAIGPFTRLFGSFLIGQPTPGQQATFTVTNTGQVTTGPLATTLIGAAAADFTVRSTTCTTLVPNASCSVVVELTPLTRGAKLAQLSVGDPVSEARATLQGNAYSLLITGATAFPSTSSGQQSATQTYKVNNASDLATGAITTSAGGSDASQFTIISTDCAAGIPAHNSCMIVVQFTPTSTGVMAATLNVSATPGGSDLYTITGRAL